MDIEALVKEGYKSLAQIALDSHAVPNKLKRDLEMISSTGDISDLRQIAELDKLLSKINDSDFAISHPGMMANVAINAAMVYDNEDDFLKYQERMGFSKANVSKRARISRDTFYYTFDEEKLPGSYSENLRMLLLAGHDDKDSISEILSGARKIQIIADRRAKNSDLKTVLETAVPQLNYYQLFMHAFPYVAAIDATDSMKTDGDFKQTFEQFGAYLIFDSLKQAKSSKEMAVGIGLMHCLQSNYNTRDLLLDRISFYRDLNNFMEAKLSAP